MYEINEFKTNLVVFILLQTNLKIKSDLRCNEVKFIKIIIKKRIDEIRKRKTVF